MRLVMGTKRIVGMSCMDSLLQELCRRLCSFLTLIIFFIQMLHEAAGSQMEKELHRSLMRGYSKYTRPVRNPSDLTEVKVSLSLVEVIEVNEDLGQLTAKMWLSMSWKDVYLKWDSERHGGIKRLNFPTRGDDRIWVPDIVLLNAMETRLGEEVDAVARHDGLVRWVQPVIYMVRVRHEFRGNSWAATFDLGSWTYDVTMIDMKPPPPRAPRTAYPARDPEAYSETEAVIDLDTESFVINDQWGVLEHSGRGETRGAHDCCPSDRFTTFHYVLKLRKKLGPSLLG